MEFFNFKKEEIVDLFMKSFVNDNFSEGVVSSKRMMLTDLIKNLEIKERIISVNQISINLFLKKSSVLGEDLATYNVFQSNNIIEAKSFILNFILRYFEINIQY